MIWGFARLWGKSSKTEPMPVPEPEATPAPMQVDPVLLDDPVLDDPGPSHAAAEDPPATPTTERMSEPPRSEPPRSQQAKKKKAKKKTKDLYAVPGNTKDAPRTIFELRQWLQQALAKNPQGLTPSMLTNLYFAAFRKAIKVDLPAFTRGDFPLSGDGNSAHTKEMLANFVSANHTGSSNTSQAQHQHEAMAAMAALATDHAAGEGQDAPEKRFVHVHSTPLGDPLKILLASMPGVVFESRTNKYILGDKYELLRVHMLELAGKIAGGSVPTMAHWQKLFRKLDKDGSGKLNRTEFYIFVRDHCHISGEDFSDELVFEIFKALDSDQGGQISTEELVCFAHKEDSVLSN